MKLLHDTLLVFAAATQFSLAGFDVSEATLGDFGDLPDSYTLITDKLNAGENRISGTIGGPNELYDCFTVNNADNLIIQSIRIEVTSPTPATQDPLAGFGYLRHAITDSSIGMLDFSSAGTYYWRTALLGYDGFTEGEIPLCVVSRDYSQGDEFGGYYVFSYTVVIEAFPRNSIPNASLEINQNEDASWEVSHFGKLQYSMDLKNWYFHPSPNYESRFIDDAVQNIKKEILTFNTEEEENSKQLFFRAMLPSLSE
ncbi:hypothetical protein [Roseibacillus ishigakijimensis]|uniref:Uncharacterized protein n=1 Tax=Roseibacillus ishigakijimensis TaxID=454146 RepID=A0A934RQZ5_9BACT|nr:hypothetical protein [Roseibacillus ishigakijimensis]MBK1835345.1 hypothetical protein [Roseibacillus ishigakijimensis]